MSRYLMFKPLIRTRYVPTEDLSGSRYVSVFFVTLPQIPY